LRCTTSRRKYSEAEAAYQRIYNARAKSLGKEAIDTLDILVWITEVLRLQEKYLEAEAAYRQLYDAREKSLGREAIDIVDTLAWIAEVLCLLGKYPEAESALRQLIDSREALYKPRPVENQTDDKSLDELLGPLGWLEDVLAKQGKEVERTVVFQWIVGIQSKSIGPDHEDTLTSLTNLAQSLQNQERYTEAVLIHRRIAEVK
jgi:tetratricopeptide (TPR) repeat protein